VIIAITVHVLLYSHTTSSKLKCPKKADTKLVAVSLSDLNCCSKFLHQ